MPSGDLLWLRFTAPPDVYPVASFGRGFNRARRPEVDGYRLTQVSVGY